MKFGKVSLFMALLLGAYLPAVAQTQTVMRVNIPFNFVAAGKSLPAGQYTVAPTFRSNEISWRLFNNQASVAMMTEPVQSSQKSHRPSLLFLQVGDQYSLVEFWPEEHLGRNVTRSKPNQIVIAESGKYVEVAVE